MTDYKDLILVFTAIIWEALPFIVLGVVIAGILEEFVPQQGIARVVPRQRFLAIALGGILGLVFPMCECGIIVVMRRLLRKGLPLSVCVSYMLAGPVLNFVVILSTYVAFNTPKRELTIYNGPMSVVLLRCGLVYLVAVVTALVVERQWKKYGLEFLSPTVTRGLEKKLDEEKEQEVKTENMLRRLGNITETALHDFIDILAFLVLGAVLAAAGRVVVKQMNLEEHIQSTPALAIALMMILAILFCICSEADAFVAANFSGIWPWASKISFLTLGPMLDFKLYLMYTRVFRPKLIWTIIISVVVQVFVYTLALHYIWPIVAEPMGWAMYQSPAP